MTQLPLYAGAGTFEKALAAAMDDELPVDYEVILDPYRTPENFLPFLAAHHSVDLWFADWTVERKREMVAQCAGVSTEYPDSPPLAELKGTFEGLRRYLWFVDAAVISRVSYPSRFVFGLSSPTFTPLQHPPFKARYLIEVALGTPFNPLIMGRAAMGLAAVRSVDLAPVERAKKAARIAKSEHAEYLISFAHRRRANFTDGLLLDGSHTVSPWLDRLTL